MFGRKSPPVVAVSGHFNFAEEVRAALANARDEALEMRHAQLGTGHVLLGMIRMPNCEGMRLLADLGVAAEEIRRRVMAEMKPGTRELRLGEMPYTDPAKRVLEQTMSEGRETGAMELTTRQLLAGLVREGRDTAARVLLSLGVTLDALRGAERVGAARFGIQVDEASDLTIYEQIVAQVQEAAATGRAAPGDRLPSVRGLADELDVAPGTVARAYGELERLGVVVTDGARGTRIAARGGPDAALREKLAGLVRPVVVAAYHQGATADDLRAALEQAMEGIYPADGGDAAPA